MKNIRLFYFAAIAFCFALVSFTTKSGTSLETIFSQQWVTKTYSDPKIQLETPKQLVKTKVQSPASSKKDISKMDAYQYDADDLIIMLSAITYKPEVKANVKGAAAGSLNEMQQRGGLEDFSYENKDTTVSGLSAIIQTGSFKKGNDRIAFRNLITVKDSHIWEIMVAYKAGNDYGTKISEKVIKSVKI
jgi:hypothetical protein